MENAVADTFPRPRRPSRRSSGTVLFNEFHHESIITRGVNTVVAKN